MNFNIDDPLEDNNLSDDESNDSFFDNPKITAKRNSLTKLSTKKSVSNLFNLTDGGGDETKLSKTDLRKSASAGDDEWLGLTAAAAGDFTTQKTTTKSNNVDDDLFGSLGLTIPPASNKQSAAPIRQNLDQQSSGDKSKKLDLFESILGPSLTRSTDDDNKINFDDILKDSKALKASSTSKYVASQPQSGHQSFEISTEGRRSRRPSNTDGDGGLNIPAGTLGLGLFGSNENDGKRHGQKNFDDNKETSRVKFKAVQAKSAPNIPDQQALPDWLGGGGLPVKSNKSEPSVLYQKSEKEPLTVPAVKSINDEDEAINKTLPSQSNPTHNMSSSLIDENQDHTTLMTQQKLAQSHIEYQNTSMALQQQESQLLMALQLKKYEDNLAGIQQQQQQVLLKQEQQFSVLLERQFEKQQILENNMRLQQERINNHIQVLISQPNVFAKNSVGELTNKSATGTKQNEEENEKLYENIISTLKQRQHEEIFLLEESYKKQISFLEQSLEQTENRLKSDLTKLSENYEEKLTEISSQRDADINKYKEKLQESQTQHAEEIGHIRENNARVIDEIKMEHAILLENIKETNKMKNEISQEANSYAQKLDVNMELLYQNTKHLQQIKDNVEEDYGILTKAREESLKAKEHEIELMKVTLEKCRQSAEQERSQLLGLVRSLETKIAEYNQNGQEERWAMQQAAGTFVARSAALDREMEFNRASIQREREQLKGLKESMLAEQERMILQLTEEKLTLAAEKSRVETQAKLSTINYDSQRAKVEMDAVIQMAQEAVAQTEIERNDLVRQKCDLEKLKRDLHDQRTKLNLRERDLDEQIRDAERKRNNGEKALFESKLVENKYNEQLKELQNQLGLLGNREKKLAEDKIMLSKERLAFHTMIKQTKRCGLCAVDAAAPPPPNFDNHYLHSVTAAGAVQDFPRFLSIDHDDAARFRLLVERTEDLGEPDDSIRLNSPIN